MKKSDLLVPFGIIYGAAAKIRNTFYEKDIFKSFDLKVPTISVGNITVGGTGKTPLVAFIAEILAARGEKICVLTRGYKRENERARVLVSDGEKILSTLKQSGDEPLELAQKLLGKALVVADANRAGAGKWAREEFGITAFVLDDAFQHLKVKRSLDIVCIDATNPFGNRRVLPQGILREPLKNLSRAGAIVITRANLIDEENLEKLKDKILKLNPTAKIFVSKNKIKNLTPLNEFNAQTQNLKDSSNEKPLTTYHSPLTTIYAFCALGNPENFFAQLKQENFNLATAEAFSDHYFYSQKDVEKLEKAAQAEGAECFITTAKDAVKLADLKFTLQCLIAESELIFDDENAFRELIRAQTLHQ